MTNIYEVLRRPLITEKSNYLNGVLHQYVFEVSANATKRMIQEAIETLFDVKVLRVNVINVPSKRKKNMRNRRMVARRQAYRKAIVTLAPEDTIGVFEGVK